MTDTTHTVSTTADDYDVGYGKPPVSTRFKPGQSGNPKGRPKGTRNFKTDLREELDSKIRIQEGQQGLVISKQQVLIKRMLESATKGNMRAMQILMGVIPKYFGLEDTAEAEKTLSEADKEILGEFFRKRPPSPGDDVEDKG